MNKHLRYTIISFFSSLISGCGISMQYMSPQELEHNQIIITSTDTLQSIAYKHKVKLSDLIKYNSLEYPYNIQVGQIISIPDSRPEEEDIKEHSNTIEGPTFGPNAVKNASSIPATTKQSLSTYSIQPSHITPANPAEEALNKIKNNKIKDSAEYTSKNDNNNDDQENENDIQNYETYNNTKTDNNPEPNDLEPVSPQERKKNISKSTNDNSEKDRNREELAGGSEIVSADEEKENDTEAGQTIADQKQPKQIEAKIQEEFVSPLQSFKNITVGKKKTLTLKPTKDATVYAVRNGEVITSSKSFPELGGKVVIIKHDYNGQTYLSIYGGFDSINEDIRTGKTKFVNTGQAIGTMGGNIGGSVGQSSSTTGILHFELRKNQLHVNPEDYISAFKSDNFKVVDNQINVKTNNANSKNTQNKKSKPKKRKSEKKS